MPGAQSTPEEKIQGQLTSSQLALLSQMSFFVPAVAKIGHMCWTGILYPDLVNSCNDNTSLVKEECLPLNLQPKTTSPSWPTYSTAKSLHMLLLDWYIQSLCARGILISRLPLETTVILVNYRIFSLQQVVKSLSEICCASTLTQDIARLLAPPLHCLCIIIITPYLPRVQSFPELVVEFMTEGDDECV